MRLCMLIWFACWQTGVWAQAVPKTIVVEHFTNTRCGICASKNPALYNNLAAHPAILHIAYHPSSPYSTCVFSQQNPAENDGRANYYGVYGSTPRVVIQGTALPGSSTYGNAALFNAYQNQTTPVNLTLTQSVSNNVLSITVFAEAVAAHTLGNVSLFVAVSEDTVQYSAPNGEAVHYDVFRKSPTGTTGTTFLMPSFGNGATYTYSVPIPAGWNTSRLSTTAILQNPTTKEVIQAARVTDLLSSLPILDEEIAVKVFPNPTTNIIFMESPTADIAAVQLFARNGALVLQTPYTASGVSVGHLPKGTYTAIIQTTRGAVRKDLVLQ